LPRSAIIIFSIFIAVKDYTLRIWLLITKIICRNARGWVQWPVFDMQPLQL
jgi:hypothetical protein